MFQMTFQMYTRTISPFFFIQEELEFNNRTGIKDITEFLDGIFCSHEQGRRLFHDIPRRIHL